MTLFTYGFRPFFLAAGLAALLLVPLWAWSIAAAAALPVAWQPSLWHAHEMVFGFVGAAIAGFLLTAVPSWTGRKGFAGWPLVALSVLWLAGRIAALCSALLPPLLVGAVSLAFLPLLAATLAWPLLRERNRNTPLLLVLALLWACQCAFHWAAVHAEYDLARRALIAAIDVVLVLVTVIGGRIVPSFTANALRLRGAKRLPRASQWLTPTAVTLMIAVAAVDALRPASAFAGVLALAAAAVQALRLSQWQGFQTSRMPIVWILHLAYAWIPIGLGLKAWALLGGGAGGANWLHALTVGAVSTMIVAVMSRTSLGHTGRRVEAHRATVLAYGLLSLAAVVRVAGPAVPSLGYVALIVTAAALWSAAFALYLWIYTPILGGPRENQP
jgi:uncharacterized protein involved in response to NO